MDGPGDPQDETYNPWSIVNLVFHHLADEGLHPILGTAGDPGGPAAELLVRSHKTSGSGSRKSGPLSFTKADIPLRSAVHVGTSALVAVSC